MLRGKMGNAGKLERFLLRKGVAYFDCSMIMNADNVARISLFYIGAILRHKNCSIGERYFLPDTVMNNFHTALKFPGANPQKRDAVTVRRIHIGLYFEGKAGKIIFIGLTSLVVVGRMTGGGAISTKASRKFLDAEIIDGAAKENRRLTGL